MKKFLLCSIFFLSGMSALILESLWFNQAGLALGNSVWSVSIVLASFMGGLALGNYFAAFYEHKIKRPILVFAVLEVIIALSGFFLVVIFPHLTRILVPAFQFFSNNSFLINILRAFIATILMVIPTTAMGLTLPLLVKALNKDITNFGSVLGLLYGYNTLGAVCGIIICEIVLIKLLGILGTGFLACLINLLVALIAWLMYWKSIQKNVDEEERASVISLGPVVGIWKFLTAAFFMGLIFLALEVLWFRFLGLFFNGDSLNFSIMLAVVLCGISLGGLLASILFKFRKEAQNLLSPILFLNGFLVAFLYNNFTVVFGILKSPISHYAKILFCALFLMFPVALISGMGFTMLGKLLHNKIQKDIKTTGLISLANTLGGMFGAFLGGVFFITFLGIERSFFIFSLMYGLIALLLFDKKNFKAPIKRNVLFYLSGILYLLSIATFPFNKTKNEYSQFFLRKSLSKNYKRVAFKEGLSETLQYLEKTILGKTYSHNLITNCHSMSGTGLRSKRYMKFFVYLATALHPNPKTALLIAYGCGSTAKALVDNSELQRIDVVDISKDVIDMSEIIFSDPKENPVNDSRIKIHIEDGRFFLLTTKQKFDIITAEPPPLKNNGIVNLYTQEFFQLIYDRLSDGGMTTYWLPVYQLEVAETKAILKAFSNVFPDCSLWRGAGLEWVMLGIKNPTIKVSEETFIKQWKNDLVAREMRALGFESPDQLGSLFIADNRRIVSNTKNSLALLDNFPRRLSSIDTDRDKVLPLYLKLAERKNRWEEFSNSKHIRNLWPDKFIKVSKEYFKTTGLIFDILENNKPVVFNLHRSLSSDLLNPYISWTVGGNYYDKNIVSHLYNKTFKPTPDILEASKYLAAMALEKKDYVLAEKYYNLLAIKSPSNLEVYQLRMYLLNLLGEKSKLDELVKEYFSKNSKDINKKELLREYLIWLNQISDEQG
ncbi:MAG: fused MFS/spermidine synthase [Candidatus Omnitrophica bacterium]|nr:fused MFS/spermidine synthase [Candidatus Omnitrophota bacterium]MCK5287550.1 fused MFS/spermidine synthase [Candidatus Omnitrophota bacterium]